MSEVSGTAQDLRWLALATVLALGVAIVPNVEAALNKCVGADGSVSYQQTPCPKSTERRSVSLLGAGKVSVATQIRQSCRKLAQAERDITRKPDEAEQYCVQELNDLCTQPESDAACDKALADKRAEVAVAEAKTLERKRRQNRTAGSSAGSSQTAAANAPEVSCHTAANFMADERRGPNQIRIECEQRRAKACAQGSQADACLLFNNKLAMTVAGRKRELAMKQDGTWNKRQNKMVGGNVNEVWTGCMAQANFADNNQEFLERKALCDAIAP